MTMHNAAHAATCNPSAVVEREQRLANHQTGNNSNVVHSGLYYAPGGYKARLAVAGCAETIAFCREHDLPHQVCGKLVVATEHGVEADIVRRRATREAHGAEVGQDGLLHLHAQIHAAADGQGRLAVPLAQQRLARALLDLFPWPNNHHKTPFESRARGGDDRHG